MNYYRAKIQYDGTDYGGFQWQKDVPSVQRDFNLALDKITGATFTTMGASRTDAGVHAFEQYIKITSQNEMAIAQMVESLNSTLPPEIRCPVIKLSNRRMIVLQKSIVIFLRT